MLPATQALIREVAERHTVAPEDILSRHGPRELMLARIEVTDRLKARGYTITKIARILQRDRHTIYDWLNRLIRS